MEDPKLDFSKTIRSRIREYLLKGRWTSGAVFLAWIAFGFGVIWFFDQHRKTVQSDATSSEFLLLYAFAWVGFATWFWITYCVNAPIVKLADFLDELKADADLPIALPKFGKSSLDLSVILKSFERLFQRLKDYRTLSLKRLLLEKRRAEIIAASMSDGILLLRDDEVLYVNPIAEKILGLSPKTFTKGLNLSSPYKELNLPCIKAIVKAVSSSLPVEFVLEEDERKFYYLIQAFPLSGGLIDEVEHSVSQSSYGVSGSSELMLELFPELFPKLEDTLVLAQDVTLVRESQEAKSHFLATLSHEVKTPVTSLTMATRLLKRSVEQIPNQTHRSLIVTCADDVDRLRRLLDDLLTISKFDTLTQRLEIQNIDIGKLLLHSVQSFQLQAGERGVSLIHRIQSQGRPIIVEMDATKIAWALSNLITNALRHTPRGGRVEAVVVSSQDNWVDVKIRDSGPGIERHRQERIFDKFNPYYDLRVARSGSIGVGLAIAREIVVAHGGRIWVVSEQGLGAEFCFTLPLRRQKNHSTSDESVSQPTVKASGLYSGKN